MWRSRRQRWWLGVRWDGCGVGRRRGTVAGGFDVGGGDGAVGVGGGVGDVDFVGLVDVVAAVLDSLDVVGDWVGAGGAGGVVGD